MSERDDRDTNIPPVDAATRAQDDAFLAPWFAEARAPVAPSADLTARLMHDALAVQPRPVSPVPAPAVPPAPSLWRWLAAALAGVGGAPGLATLGAAALGGVWIGLAVPEPAAGIVAGVWQGAALVGSDPGLEADLADLTEDGGLLALIEDF